MTYKCNTVTTTLDTYQQILVTSINFKALAVNGGILFFTSSPTYHVEESGDSLVVLIKSFTERFN